MQIIQCLEGVSQSARQAVFVRMDTLLSHLNLRDTSELVTDDLSHLQNFEKKIQDLQVTDLEKVSFFYLALLGRYLTSKEIEFLVHEWRTQSLNLSQLSYFSQEFLRASFERVSRVRLYSPSKECLLIDVTHTMNYPVVSGIQRVVRQVVHECYRLGKNFQLIYIDGESNQPILFSEERFQAFLSFKPKKSNNESLFSFLRWDSDSSFFYNFFRILFQFMILPLRLNLFGKRRSPRALYLISSAKDRCLKVLRAYKYTQEVFNYSDIQVPIFHLQTILVPELVAENYRVKFYLSLSQQSQYRLTMIGYDLIPVYQPEFCVISALFCDYLRLLRVVDRVSCISVDVAKQFRRLSEGVYRLNARPLVIQSHDLAGNSLGLIDGECASDDRSLPMILCVGTIEPRKNHLNVLRAAEFLWKKGLRFSLVFAGNDGWLAQEFFSYFDQLKKSGRDVKHFCRPSDDELKRLYQESSFTVFCSFAEGYGLPIVESLNFGKPCITSSIGCMADIAQEGGCETVNPNSPVDIASKMELLLVNQDHLRKLKSEIKVRPVRTWANYAAEVYSFACDQTPN